MYQQIQWNNGFRQVPTTPQQQQVQPVQQPAQQTPPAFYAPQIPPGAGQQTTMPQIPGMLPMEMSYIENILRLNHGKRARVYMTFENNSEWNAKVFTGFIEAAGRDHIVLSDPDAGKYYLLLMVSLDYVEFDEPIEYNYPFQQGQTSLATYSPR